MKRVLATLAGIGTAIILIFSGEGLSGRLFPMPDAAGNKEALAKAMSLMPIGFFIFLLVNYAIAAFLAAWVATRISGKETITPVVIIAILLTAGGLLNLSEIPHPLWFSCCNIPEYALMAGLGYWAAKKSK